LPLRIINKGRPISIRHPSINKKLLEELGRLLIDFAGQSDTFIFDSQDQ